MALTISDIAAQAGVSKATVSRVLNNRPEGVGAETRTRIEAIVRETGFQRSAVARRLATGRSRTVGLIIPDIANPFYPLLVRGVERALSHSGYSLLLCNSDRPGEGERLRPHSSGERRRRRHPRFRRVGLRRPTPVTRQQGGTVRTARPGHRRAVQTLRRVRR